ncbi:hypothetical protein GOBAR_DD27864 [Gossypium barbadense]|nr:hypothetical protein GOBAR_DD27864 [Gossypium barbadense]
MEELKTSDSSNAVMEAGVVIEKAVNCPPLDVRNPVSNVVAYEQCHPKCKAYVTSYLFFFDAEDVGLLHHKGVLRHCLGGNKEVAKLVNGLCKEIARDGRESYLCKVVHDMNTCCNGSYAWFRAGSVHHYI